MYWKDVKCVDICTLACLSVQNYELVVTGHSLGAGTAVIISILMKTVYKNVHCYAFSPPGGLLR